MNTKTAPQQRPLTLRVVGDLISTNAQGVRKEIDELFGNSETAPFSCSTLRLDLSEAQMVDSVGLNLIVFLLKRVQKLGAKLQVAYSSPNVLRTFTFTRLDRHLELLKV